MEIKFDKTAAEKAINDFCEKISEKLGVTNVKLGSKGSIYDRIEKAFEKKLKAKLFKIGFELNTLMYQKIIFIFQ